MASKKKTSTHKHIPIAGVAAGVLAAAAAAGATYYFYGSKQAKKHRTATAKWAEGMRAQVIKEAKKLSNIDDEVMAQVIDNVARVYNKAKSATPQEIEKASAELKSNWRRMQASFKGSAKKAVKKTVKRVAKKVTKRPVSK